MLRGTANFDVGNYVAFFVPLPVNPPVPSDLHLQPLGEGVDYRDSHAMQSARDAVRFVVELASSMQDSHHDLQGRPVELRMIVYGDASTVIRHGDAAVLVERHFDLFAVATQGLIHAVVHYFIDQVVQPQGIRTADIHGRPAPDCLKAFKNLDLAGIIARCIAQN
ncbi:Uncharacterised protein [uncultured archaeon]|nr:Uncharacterised protein [uncultured archaeon]